MPLEPSSPVRERSAKIVIDATRQWPEEGGPDVYPGRNRALLEEGAPEAIPSVDAEFGELLRSWTPPV